MQIQPLTVDTEGGVKPTDVELPKLSWASQQALAILAVDGMRPSATCMQLMEALDHGTMTHEQAVQVILKKAAGYANNQSNELS